MDPQINEEFKFHVEVNGNEVTFLLDRPVAGVRINLDRSYPIAAVKQEINNAQLTPGMKKDLMKMLEESFSSHENTVDFLSSLARILNNIL